MAQGAVNTVSLTFRSQNIGHFGSTPGGTIRRCPHSARTGGGSPDAVGGATITVPWKVMLLAAAFRRAVVAAVPCLTLEGLACARSAVRPPEPDHCPAKCRTS